MRINCAERKNIMSVDREVQKNECLRNNSEKLLTWSRKSPLKVLKMKVKAEI